MDNDNDYPPSLIPQESLVEQTTTTVERGVNKIGAFFWDILETIVFALAIFVIVYLFLAQPHQVQGNSMVPNFLSGEYILTNKITYRFEDPERGHVVVFKSPLEKDFIKRIIAVPGEKIKILGGKVYINDKLLNESYLPATTFTQEGLKLHDGETLTLPEGQYAVFGDNRNQSYDTRDWGFIEKKDIIGKAWVIYWPLNKMGFVPHADYDF